MTGLRQAALSGARWTVAARIGLQLVTWPITIVVMRLLAPADYGLFAIALVVTGFITLFAELGLGVALVQAPELTPAQARMASSLVILLNGLIAAALVLLAPLVATVFEEPGVTAVIQVLTLELLFAAFAAVPMALLERALKIREVSIAQMAAGICGAAVTLAAALLDAGVWALVAGSLSAGFVRSAGLIAFHGRLVWPGALDLGSLRPMIRVSGQVLAARVLWYWSGHADQMVLGRILHASILGLYNVAAQLAMLPAGKAMEAVNRVAFPILSRLRGEAAGLQDMHRRITALLALYGFGICWGLGAVAPEFVLAILGQKWQPAAVPLAVLALVAPLRMLCAFHNTVVTAAGVPQVATRELLLASVLMPLAVGLGAWLQGLHGASLAWLLAYPVVYLFSSRLTSRAIGLGFLVSMRPLAAPLMAGLAMLVAVEASRRAMGAELTVLLRLPVEVAVGAMAYLGVLWLVARRLLLETWSLALELVRPGRSGG
ncbi:MAG: oligosaccharide flippase family protein [Burkholderiaceae bacterium]|nr:oligosaccharide flippase family protein [Burkholderiaceae bacterium]